MNLLDDVVQPDCSELPGDDQAQREFGTPNALKRAFVAVGALLTVMAFGSKASASGNCSNYCQAQFQTSCYGPGVYLGRFYDPSNSDCGNDGGSFDTSLSSSFFGQVNFVSGGYSISSGCLSYGGCNIFSC